MSHFKVSYNNFPDWAKEIVIAFDESDINYNANDILLYASIVCIK